MSDVLIAGAGPVGLTCALALARRGVPVTVLERGPELSRASRASTFHPGTLDLLTPLGVTPGLVSAGRVVDRVQWRNLSGRVLAEMDFALLAGLTGHPFRLHAEQTVLTRLLARELAAVPHAQLIFDRPVTDVAAAKAEFGARYLVAADGAHSTVRAALGIGFPGAEYPHYALRVITGTPLDEVVPGLAALAYVRDSGLSFSVLGLRDHWRLIFRVPAGTDPAEVTRPAAVDDLVRRALPGRRIEVGDAHTYRVARRVLDSYRHGDVFFAGDAAHLTSTAGGLNMNAGLHDAVALAGTLAELLDGAPDSRADDWAAGRRAALVDTVLPLSEARARGAADTTELRAAVEEVMRTAADSGLSRSYLARSSLLG